MSSFVTPQAQDNPTYPGQAWIDATDVAALALSAGGYSVVKGCAVTVSSGMVLNVASGQILSNNVGADVSAGTVTVSTASSHDRRDIVVSHADGTPAVVQGSPCTTANWTINSGVDPPVKPAIPSGSVLLAEVYVQGAAGSLTSNNLTAKRVPSGTNALAVGGIWADEESNSLSASSYNKPIVFTTRSATASEDTASSPDLTSYVSDYRTISTNGSGLSSHQPPLFAGSPTAASVAHKVYMEEDTSTNSITKAAFLGYGVEGYFGLHSPGGTDLSNYGYLCAFASHLDAAVPVYGIYWGQAHIGLLGATGQQAYEMGILDVNAINSFGAYSAHAFVLRVLDGNIGGNMGNNVDPWALYIGNYDSVHRGNLLIGGTQALAQDSYRSHPTAQVDIRSLTNAAPGGANLQPLLQLYTNTPAGSDVASNRYQNNVLTTNATQTNLIVNTIDTSSVYMVKARVWARQTAGSSGTVGQGGAWDLTALVAGGVTVGTISGTAGIGTVPTGWAATIGAGLGGLTIQVTGHSNEDITWHGELIVFGPVAT